MKQNGENFIEKHKVWIGALLITAVTAESAYLLWRKNYLEPSIVKRISAMEERLDSFQNSDPGPGIIKPLDIDKVLSESKSSDQKKEESKTAVAQPDKVTDKVSNTKNGKVNINNASIAELDTLPRVGISTANKIIEYRQKSGGFKTIEEIKNVKGIGDATFNQMKDRIAI